MNRQHITASEEEMGAAHKKYYGIKIRFLPIKACGISSPRMIII